MISTIYKRALGVLMQKPLKLWGISLLYSLLSSVLVGLCGVAIPGLGLAVGLLLSTSMLMVYLHGYRGEDVKVIHLFDCFKDWATIKRVVCGLAWMLLWVFLWSLIPFVGWIFAIIRTYEYRLVPYILITEPDVAPTEAIKVSSQRTRGYKLQMWGAEVLLGIIVGVGLFILSLIFGLMGDFGIFLTFVLYVVVIALLPLAIGLIQAAFYEEISNPSIPTGPSYGAAPQAPVAGFCGNCGTPFTSADAAFCPVCGTPKN